MQDRPSSQSLVELQEEPRWPLRTTSSSGAPPEPPASGVLGVDEEPAVGPEPAMVIGWLLLLLLSDFCWQPKMSPIAKSDKLNVLLCFMIKRSPFPQRRLALVTHQPDLIVVYLSRPRSASVSL